jgi:hypothetical protein
MWLLGCHYIGIVTDDVSCRIELQFVNFFLYEYAESRACKNVLVSTSQSTNSTLAFSTPYGVVVYTSGDVKLADQFSNVLSQPNCSSYRADAF